MEKAKEKYYTTSENKLARWCQLMNVNKMEELKEIVGDDLMEEEAREQGIEQGIEQVIKNMLRNNISIEEINKMTNIFIDIIKKFCN